MNRLRTGKWTASGLGLYAPALAQSITARKFSRCRDEKRPAPRPDAAELPFTIPANQRGDFYWLLSRTSVEDRMQGESLYRR